MFFNDMTVSLKYKANYDNIILLYSPEPNGEELRYTISITIDGKTFAELGGTQCNRCDYFDVSLNHSSL